MNALTWIVVAAAAGILVYVLLKRLRKPVPVAPLETPAERTDPLAPAATAGGDPLDIRVADELDGLGYGEKAAVRGTAKFREGRYTWTEHYLDDDRFGKRRWLSVELDGGDLEIILWSSLTGTDLIPGRDTLVHDGHTYEFDEEGRADYTTEGTTDLAGTSGKVSYIDYKCEVEGGLTRYLSFERYDGGDWEISYGEIIPNGLLTIYPGS